MIVGGIQPSGSEGEKAVKHRSFALAGLFVVTIAAPASADDGSKYLPAPEGGGAARQIGVKLYWLPGDAA